MNRIRFNPEFFFSPTKRPRNPNKLAVPKWKFRDPVLNTAFAPARSGESLFSKGESAHLLAVTHRITLDRLSNLKQKYMGYLLAVSGGGMALLGPATYIIDNFKPGIPFTAVGIAALAVGLKVLQKK
ncbi:hypothetical protein K2P56_01485 [Patescibacteria group bacterium]|nr:hypothetical protein [Patescibacteria group bacterium]